MNGTPEVGPMSTAEAIDFRNIINAESVTILIHGVGAGTSRALLDDATGGYRDSGFDRPVTRIPLPDCPSLLGEKSGEVILINGRTGGHFIVALPWSKRLRLGVLAKRCTIALTIVTIVTVMGSVFNLPISWLYSSKWHTFLIYPVMTIVAPIVSALIQGGKEQYQVSPMGLSLLLAMSFGLQLTFTWWAPWLWAIVAFLIAILWIMASYTIIRCIPIAKTLGWQVILLMLVAVSALFGVAIVRTTSHYSRETEKNLARNIVKRVQVLNLSKVLPKELPIQDYGVASESGSKTEVVDKRESYRDKISSFLSVFDWDLGPCLTLAAICIAVSWFISRLDSLLDLGLDVLAYESDQKGTNSLLVGFGDAIRWFNRQAPNAHLTVVGHSLGSVIAAHAVSAISASEPLPCQMTLITLGSPLNYLYRVFPIAVKSPRELEETICFQARWVNLWRKSDEVGRELDTNSGIPVQYCIGNGGHSNYWKDGAVWDSVVYESLKVGDFRGTSTAPGKPARGWLESYLGLKAVVAIAVLFTGSLVMWYLPIWFEWMRSHLPSLLF